MELIYIYIYIYIYRYIYIYIYQTLHCLHHHHDSHMKMGSDVGYVTVSRARSRDSVHKPLFGGEQKGEPMRKVEPGSFRLPTSGSTSPLGQAPRAPSQGHHTIDRLVERGVERRESARSTIFLERTWRKKKKGGHRQSDQHWNWQFLQRQHWWGHS